MTTARPDGDDLGPFQMCAPAKASASASALAGLAVWVLVTWVPQFHRGVPLALQDALPFVLGWAVHVLTAWAVPHPMKAAAPDAPRPEPAVPASGGSAPPGLPVAGGPAAPPEAGPGSPPPSTGTGGFPPSAFPGTAQAVRHFPPGPGWRRW